MTDAVRWVQLPFAGIERFPVLACQDLAVFKAFFDRMGAKGSTAYCAAKAGVLAARGPAARVRMARACFSMEQSSPSRVGRRAEGQRQTRSKVRIGAVGRAEWSVIVETPPCLTEIGFDQAMARGTGV